MFQKGQHKSFTVSIVLFTIPHSRHNMTSETFRQEQIPELHVLKLATVID